MPLAILALAAAQTFVAGTPAFDPRLHKKEIAGQPARVLVLGSPHLSQLPNKLDAKLLDPMLDRLAAFRPDVITVEGLSGEESTRSCASRRSTALHGTIIAGRRTKPKRQPASPCRRQ